MVDVTIKKALLANHGFLNFMRLLDFMESSGIRYEDKKINGPLGIATYYTIYLDTEKILTHHPMLLYFIILHETAHYKRIVKMGGKDGVIKLLSIDDFDIFCENIIKEEIFADRYASYLFRCFNKINFPREATQQLDLKHVQDKYKENSARHLFGVVDNNEEKYKQLLESFLI